MEAFSNNHLKYQLINPNIGGPKDQLYIKDFIIFKEEEIFSPLEKLKENETCIFKLIFLSSFAKPCLSIFIILFHFFKINFFKLLFSK